jgi:hypothetical protein
VLGRKAGIQVTSHAVPTRLGRRVSEVRGRTWEKSAAAAKSCARDNSYCESAATLGDRWVPSWFLSPAWSW